MKIDFNFSCIWFLVFSHPPHIIYIAGIQANDRYGEQYSVMFSLAMTQLKQVGAYDYGRPSTHPSTTHHPLTSQPPIIYYPPSTYTPITHTPTTHYLPIPQSSTTHHPPTPQPPTPQPSTHTPTTHYLPTIHPHPNPSPPTHTPCHPCRENIFPPPPSY